VTSIGELLLSARERLRRADIDLPGREAALLLRDLLGMSEAALLARDRDSVPLAIESRFLELLERRCAHEPMAYLLEEREFFGRVFTVDRRVLVPRPETELLVETALALDLPADARVLDIGTGSGCIALTLAAEREGWSVFASDRSIAALAVARENRRRWGIEARVRLVAADLVGGLALDRFDLVVANLPYLAISERPNLETDVRDYEPESALFAGGDGFDLVAALLTAGRRLRAGANLLAEIGATQGPEAKKFASDVEIWSSFEVRPDLAGHDRLVVARRRS